MINIYQDSGQLFIKKNNILCFIFFSVFITPFLLVPIIFVFPSFFELQQHTLRCKRHETQKVICQIQSKNIITHQKKEATLVNIRELKIITNRKYYRDEIYEFYQLQLITEYQHIAFGSYLNESEISNIANQIKSYLNNINQGDLEIQINKLKPYFGITPLVIFFLVWYGILIIAIIKVLSQPLFQVWEFNLNYHHLIINQFLIFKVSKKYDYSLSDKSYLEIEKTKNSDGDYMYVLYLVLDSEKKLILVDSRSEVEKLFEVIGDFFNCNPQSKHENKQIRYLKITS